MNEFAFSLSCADTWSWLPSVLQIAAILLTLIYAMFLAQRNKLDVMHMYLAGVAAIIGAMIISRVWVILWSIESIETFDQLWFGPRGVIGAFLGAAICGGLYLRIRKLSLVEYADASLPAIVLGYFIARLGCLAAGDDFGIPTDMIFGIQFGPGTQAYALHLSRGWIESGSNNTLSVHPTQIYHLIVAATVYLVLISGAISQRRYRLILAVIVYGGSRFVIQYFRDDHWYTSYPFDSAQMAALIFMVIGVMALLILRRTPLKTAGDVDTTGNNKVYT